MGGELLKKKVEVESEKDWRNKVVKVKRGQGGRDLAFLVNLFPRVWGISTPASRGLDPNKLFIVTIVGFSSLDDHFNSFILFYIIFLFLAG